MSDEIRSFKIDVSEADLEDLKVETYCGSGEIPT